MALCFVISRRVTHGLVRRGLPGIEQHQNMRETYKAQYEVCLVHDPRFRPQGFMGETDLSRGNSHCQSDGDQAVSGYLKIVASTLILSILSNVHFCLTSYFTGFEGNNKGLLFVFDNNQKRKLQMTNDKSPSDLVLSPSALTLHMGIYVTSYYTKNANGFSAIRVWTSGELRTKVP